jgi:hypothetical protein
MARGSNYGADPMGSGSPTGFVPMSHVLVTNNVIAGLDNPQVQGGGATFQIGDVAYLSIEHNTAFNPSATSPSETFFLLPGAAPSPHRIIRDNLVGGGNYPIFAPNGTWNTVADVSTSVFTNNVIVGGAEVAAAYPRGNVYPASYAELGLVGGPGAATSPSATLEQLALSPASPFRGRGTDGRDIGADIAAVLAAIKGVVPTTSAPTSR